MNMTKKKNKKIKKNIGENKKEYQLEKYIRMPQEIVKDWLMKIKIHKIKKFNSIFSTNQGLIGKENSI